MTGRSAGRPFSCAPSGAKAGDAVIRGRAGKTAARPCQNTTGDGASGPRHAASAQNAYVLSKVITFSCGAAGGVRMVMKISMEI